MRSPSYQRLKIRRVKSKLIPLACQYKLNVFTHLQQEFNETIAVPLYRLSSRSTFACDRVFVVANERTS